MKSKNSGLAIGAVFVAAVALITGCSEVAEPQAITDEERDHLAEVVADASWIEDAVCNVEVFRQDGDITYGWAECTNILSEAGAQLEQADSAPFRAEGDTVQVPDDGSQYPDEIRKLFPADLISTIEEYSGITSPATPNE